MNNTYILHVIVEIGFCDFETTSTLPYDIYSWPETEIGVEVVQRCNFGNNGKFGNATRSCGVNGWDSPDLTQCVDATTVGMYNTVTAL